MWGNPILVMGSGHIGERIDRTLVREGAGVVVHSRDEERAGRVAAETRDATASRPKSPSAPLRGNQVGSRVS